MFKEMRNLKKQLTNEDMISILREGEYGILATIGENGYPHTTPLNYVYINNVIYFHCAPEGYKLDNINSNNKVSFCVIGETKVLPDKFSTKYESTIIYGRASNIIEEEEKKTALLAIIDKYSPEFKNEGLAYIDRAISKTNLVKIIIDHATAKGNID